MYSARKASYRFARNDAERLYLDVFAPVVIAFCEWILEQAKRDGVERIYFMARDMWQCYRASLLLLQKNDYSVEIRYLYTSRRSLFFEDEDILKGYLKQESLYDGKTFAIADSGWLGTTIERIEKITNQKCFGYFFGLYAIPFDMDRKRLRAYYFLPFGYLKRKTGFANSLLEAVFCEPVPTTVGYEYSNGEYLPVKDKTTNPNEAILKRFAELSEIYTRKYLMKYSYKPKAVGAKKKIVEGLLSTLMSNPLPNEIRAIGNLAFSANDGDFSFEEVACIWTDKEYESQKLFRKIYLKLKGKTLHESAWPQASFIRNKNYRRRDLYGEVLYRWLMYLRMSAEDIINSKRL